MQASSILRIEKEEIPFYQFLTREDSGDAEQKKEQDQQLKKACELGNLHKGKVLISFLTSKGPREIYTTVWGVGQSYINLKKGLFLPKDSILGVNF